MTAPRLITITFSHFCEKARWALDRSGIQYVESGHLPPFHTFDVRKAGGKRAVPVLVTDDGVLNDSTDILQWIDQRAPEMHLYGRNESERNEIAKLEDYFDEKLGAHSRRWLFFHLLPHRELSLGITKNAPVASYERRTFETFFPIFRALLRKGLNINPESVARSRTRIDEALEHVGKLIADGRQFLVGNSLSAADITFASLVGVVLLAEEYTATLPTVSAMPNVAQEQIRAWQKHPAGEFALRLFREHRIVRS